MNKPRQDEAEYYVLKLKTRKAFKAYVNARKQEILREIPLSKFIELRLGGEIYPVSDLDTIDLRYYGKNPKLKISEA